MRQIHDHKVSPANDTLNIDVLDEPGAGGANHLYSITGADVASNPSASLARCIVEQSAAMGEAVTPVVFQNGPINEAGVNGVTQEALLAIVADRLRSFQAGPYACRENALALTKVEEAMMWLQKRTLDRMRRGVEGTHEK